MILIYSKYATLISSLTYSTSGAHNDESVRVGAVNDHAFN